MKIFKFDPKTGKRGELIEEMRRASWTGCSLKYAEEQGLVEKVDVVHPKGAADQDITIHTDAGRTEIIDDQFVDISYQRDEWICFCTGKWNGADTEDGYAWCWIILPPKGLLKWIEQPVEVPDCSPAGEPC